MVCPLLICSKDLNPWPTISWNACARVRETKTRLKDYASRKHPPRSFQNLPSRSCGCTACRQWQICKDKGAAACTNPLHARQAAHQHPTGQTSKQASGSELKAPDHLQGTVLLTKPPPTMQPALNAKLPRQALIFSAEHNFLRLGRQIGRYKELLPPHQGKLVDDQATEAWTCLLRWGPTCKCSWPGASQVQARRRPRLYPQNRVQFGERETWAASAASSSILSCIAITCAENAGFMAPNNPTKLLPVGLRQPRGSSHLGPDLRPKL